MLHLYQSNRLEILLELLSAVIAEPLSNPLAKETVIVQSKGMGRWISLRLAEKQAICANIDFPLPASYLWQLLCENLENLPKRSTYSPEIMTWSILNELKTADALDPRLSHYLKDGSECRQFELAQRIALAFDQYLIYRPDWIASFEQSKPLNLGPDESWQASIWRAVSSNNEPHRAELIAQLLKKIEAPADTFGERIILFGISSLPPIFIEVIKRLSQVMEVCFFVLNPCQKPWGDIKDQKEIARLSGDQAADELYLFSGNPLLASLGKQGREFFDRLLSENLDIHDLFQEEAPETLLKRIQSDLLNLIDRSEFPDEPLPKALEECDRSIQIHVCHSAMREIEVLKDQLLLLFEQDHSLQPSDIAVLTPDIHAYAPFIEAVFASDAQPRIPFSIADLDETANQPLIEHFMQLLELPHSRFEASWVLDFLTLPALREKFCLTESDLPMIHEWVRKTGIRWGKDKAQRKAMNLPEEALNTWQEGLQRILLGYALPQAVCEEGIPLFESVLPYDDIEGSLAETLGHFAEFIETMSHFSRLLTPKRSLTDWTDALNGLLEAFFKATDETEEEALQKLRDSFEALTESGELSEFKQSVGLSVISRWLSNQLKEISTGGFLTGGVTFCAMVPMRCLPFKVICLIGMNDGVFPRQTRPISFDLIAQHPRAGDRSRRLDDRYLFLETLLSVREKLYISYVGKNIRDNASLPPSVLVSDLIDLIKASGPENCMDDIVTEHFLQAFNPGYFQADPKHPSFSNTWLEAARCLGHDQHLSSPLFDEVLPEPGPEWQALNLKDLDYFYANPARFILKKRIGLMLPQEEEPIANREPFELAYFDKSLIRESIVKQTISTLNLDDAVYQITQASGLLPHGAFGKALFEEEKRIGEKFKSNLSPFLEDPLFEPVSFCFETEKHRLEGTLTGLRPNGLTVWSIQKQSARHLFSLWLNHICLCLLKPEGIELKSRLICLDKTVSFKAIEQPQALLENLLDYYRQGLCRPLPFFVKSAHAYAKTQDLKAAHKIWDASGVEEFFGESENIWYQSVYRGTDPLDERFENLSVDLFNPLLQALE